MDGLWEVQKVINENNNAQMGMMIEQLRMMIGIIEDHEKDMEKMAEHINELEKEISELKNGR